MYQRDFAKLLPLTALLGIGLLAVLPPTAWLVRLQLETIAAGTMPGVFTSPQPLDNLPHDRCVAAAAAHPDDYLLQLGAALGPDDRTSLPAPLSFLAERGSDVPALQRLESRFGGRPGLHAHVLVSLPMHYDRAEETALQPPGAGPVTTTRLEPALFRIADTEARWGERIDPTNAFFPTVRARALLGVGRDSEAIAELDRASRSARWDVYADETVRARLAISRAVNGDRGSLDVISAVSLSTANERFPWNAGERAFTRAAIGMAIVRERRGDVPTGFTIRRSIARIGALQRAYAPSAIDALVGYAVSSMASAHPAGALPLDPRLNGDARAAAGFARYAAYLNRIGHPEEAGWFLAEMKSAERMRTTMRRAPDLELHLIDWNAAACAAALSALVLAFLVLFCGAIATLLRGTGRIREGLPLGRGVRCGIGLLLASPMTVGALAVAYYVMPLQWGAAIIAVVPLLVPLALLARGGGIPRFVCDAAIALATVAAMAALAGVAYCAFAGPSEAVMTAAEAAMPTQNGATALPAGMSEDTAGVIVHVALVAAALAITIGIGMFAGRGLPQPTSVRVVRGLSTSVASAAGVLLLFYVAATGIAAWTDRELSTVMMHEVTDEPRYMASLVGVPLPDPQPTPPLPQQPR